MVLDDSDPSVPDGDDCALLDEFGGLALEEGVGSASLISDDCSDKGALSVVALGLLHGDHLHKHVVAIPGVHEAVDLHKDRLGEF